MSFDIQFVSLVDSLQILEASEILGASPRTVRLRSSGGFQDAQRVLINEYGVDSFTIISEKYILVYPPALFDSLKVSDMSFAVISGAYSGGSKARLSFGLTRSVKKVDGLQKLVQVIVKTLLSKSNSNKFVDAEGGDLLSSIGQTLSEDSRSQISAAVAKSVSQTEEQVKIGQQLSNDLLPSERLLSLTLTSVAFNSAQRQVLASIKLLTYAGVSIDIPLTL